MAVAFRVDSSGHLRIADARTMPRCRAAAYSLCRFVHDAQGAPQCYSDYACHHDGLAMLGSSDRPLYLIPLNLQQHLSGTLRHGYQSNASFCPVNSISIFAIVMRSIIPEYFTPTDEEFKQLWHTGIFVPDTNVLLSLYRLKPSTRDNLIEIFQSVSDRMWMPHQVAVEFARRRPGVMLEQLDAYTALQERIEMVRLSLRDALTAATPNEKHPFIDRQSVESTIDRSFAKIRTALNKGRAAYPDLMANDTILATIMELFDGRVGSPYEEPDHTRICEEGHERYMASIPPGYCDAKKDGDDRYGDLLLWKQVLDHATKIGTPVILITDDKKEDWWWKVKGRTIGPRHEMRAEMLRVAGTLYYQYSTEQFMKHSGAMLDVPATEEAIEEVRLVNLNYDAGLRELEKATGLSMSAFPEIETKAAELAKAFASPDVPNFASTSATELIARWDQEHRERLQNPFGLTAQHLAPSLGLDNGPKIHDRLMQTLSALGLASSSAVETIAAWDRERTELLANTMGRTMQELAAAIGVGPAVMASKAFVQNVLSPLDETASSLRASLLGTALFESMKYSYPGSSLTRNAQGPTDATPDAEEDDGESS